MTRQDDQVQICDFAPMETKDLTHQPFQTIAIDCTADLFLGDR